MSIGSETSKIIQRHMAKQRSTHLQPSQGILFKLIQTKFKRGDLGIHIDIDQASSCRRRGGVNGRNSGEASRSSCYVHGDVVVAAVDLLWCGGDETEIKFAKEVHKM